MNDLLQTGACCAVVQVDRRIYCESVISKAVYALSHKYGIGRRMISDETEEVAFRSLQTPFCNDSFYALQEQWSLLLNDYKLRQTIAEETKEIRTILYIKAFANNDNFEEFTEEDEEEGKEPFLKI